MGIAGGFTVFFPDHGSAHLARDTQAGSAHSLQRERLHPMEQRTSLRLERERRGWTQAEVAERIGTTELSISRWERGTVLPRPYYRAQLATLFGLSQDALGLTTSPPSPPPPAHASLPSAEQETRGIVDPTLPILPPTPIVGRDEELIVLKERLCTGHHLVLTALQGLPGVGKTTLAICLVHDQQVRAHFADGILWVGLGKYPTIPGQLRRWGSLLGLSHSDMDALHQRHAWATAFHTAMGTRRMLLVIDDVWNIEDAWPFLVAAPNCAHLITTRFPHLAHQLVPDGATVVQELDVQHSVHLLGLLAPKAIVQERQKAQELAKVVGGLPLALTLMGHYLRQQSYDGHTRRIRTAIERLGDARARLQLSEWFFSPHRYHSLSSDETVSLQSAINVSEQLLDDQARQALYALSVFPAKPESFSEEAACAIAACEASTLDTLVDLGLLESASADRYTLHQTVADYARAHLHEQHPFERLIAYVDSFLQQQKKAYEVQAQERHLIQAALESAISHGMQRAQVRLSRAFLPFLLVRAEYETASALTQQALEAAQTCGDEEGMTALLRLQGQVLHKQGQLAEAVTISRAGLQRARERDQSSLLCLLLIDLGKNIAKQSAYTEAEPYVQEGLQLARDAHDEEAMCLALNTLSGICADSGSYVQAASYAQEGLAIAQHLGDPEQTVFLCLQLGAALSWQGKCAEARPVFEQGLALARQMGHRVWTGTLLVDLGVGELYEGNLQAAERYFQQCLPLAEQTVQDEWVSVLYVSMAEVEIAQGRLTEAEAHLQQSLDKVLVCGYTRLHAYVLEMWGNLELKRQQLDAAAHHYRTMVTLLPEHDRDVQGLSHYGLARVAKERGQMQEARAQAEMSLALLEQMQSQAARDVRAWMQQTWPSPEHLPAAQEKHRDPTG